VILIEIRLAIQRTDKYSGTHYFIRYFQYDGVGLLRYDQQHAFAPNNLYPAPAEKFRLYYTSTVVCDTVFHGLDFGYLR
jgi:hypothetical protein